MSEALSRLQKLPEFKFVIHQGYFREHLDEMLLAKTDPDQAAPANQAHLASRIDAIGHLKRFFTWIDERAEMSKKVVEDGESLLDELRAQKF